MMTRSETKISERLNDIKQENEIFLMEVVVASFKIFSHVPVTKDGVRDWLNGFIYYLYAPPIITLNCSSIAISTIYNSLLHTYLSSPGNAIKTQEL
jgi:hypothetical protein